MPSPVPDPLLEEILALDPERLPNAWLIGAMKSGTSWMARQLEFHTDAFVPGIKEPNLLAKPLGSGADYAVKGPVDTETLFHQMHRFSARDGAHYGEVYGEGQGKTIRLDASIRYLNSELAADRLDKLLAAKNIAPRILVTLREPVARSWSHWQMHRTMGVEPLSFAAALEAEDARMAEGMSDDFAYRGYSDYGPQLERYITRFGRENIHVEFFETVMEDRDAARARVFGFLGLDPERADRSVTDKAVRVQRKTGSSEVEQMARYWRPSWRKAIPKPIRQGIWRGLQAFNTSGKQRGMPEKPGAKLAEQLAHVAGEVEALTGRTPPWNAEAGDQKR